MDPDTITLYCSACRRDTPHDCYDSQWGESVDTCQTCHRETRDQTVDVWREAQEQPWD